MKSLLDVTISFAVLLKFENSSKKLQPRQFEVEELNDYTETYFLDINNQQHYLLVQRP